MPWCTVALERVEIRNAMSDSGVFVCQLILSAGQLMIESSDPSPSVLFRRNVIPPTSQMVMVVVLVATSFPNRAEGADLC